jgi:transcription-repair coupling factor (superfamily II helicase)
MFGLSQIYQLRGRVGRAKLRAYALLTLPAVRKITPQAERRLKVLQSLDTLGAGFQLASHDLDIRGAGNLLGDEQSGHIKEVGYELYQQMLEEAVAEPQGRHQRAGRRPLVAADHHRHAGADPGGLRADLPVRLALYRRLAEIEDDRDIEASAPSWSTASARCRRRSSICCKSSPSNRCAGAPMSKRSKSARKARCCRSATTPSPTPKA